MNGICLAAPLETTPPEFAELQVGVGQRSLADPFNRAYFQSGRRLTPAAAF